jgi:hypothetical protein
MFHVIKKRKTQMFRSQKPTYKLHVRFHIHSRITVSKGFINRNVHAGKKPTSDHLSQSKIYTDINKKYFLTALYSPQRRSQGLWTFVIVAEKRKNKNDSPAIKEKVEKAEEMLRGRPPSSEGS